YHGDSNTPVGPSQVIGRSTSATDLWCLHGSLGSLKELFEFGHQNLCLGGGAGDHKARVLTGERAHYLLSVELVEHERDTGGVPLIGIDDDDVLPYVEVAHEQFEALLQFTLDVLLSRKWRRAVSVLTLAG